jgi:hypothetical protein
MCVNQDPELAELTSVHFTRLRKSEKLGDGLHMHTPGIQNSSPPRCGLIHAIPSLIEKFERGELCYNDPCLVLFRRQI